MSVAALAFSTPSFSERVSNLLERVDYRLVLSDADKDAIFRLRYEAYLREGALAPNFAQRLSDRFDELDNTWTFGVFLDGRHPKALIEERGLVFFALRSHAKDDRQPILRAGQFLERNGDLIARVQPQIESECRLAGGHRAR